MMPGTAGTAGADISRETVYRHAVQLVGRRRVACDGCDLVGCNPAPDGTMCTKEFLFILFYFIFCVGESGTTV